LVFHLSTIAMMHGPINIRYIFRKSVEKIHVSMHLKSIVCSIHEDPCTFMAVSSLILLKIRNILDKSCRESQNTHFVFSISFFLKSVPFMR
jgi:hypothetical protein